MPALNHQNQSIQSVACAVLTVSDTRTLDNDTGGQLICDLLIQNGHVISTREIVRDDPDQFRAALQRAIDDANCAAVLMTGGTGLSPRDSTYEVVNGLLEKRLDGFGELFRQKSFAEIGPAAMLSRAIAGVAGRTAIFSMPGSPAAVRLAMNELILPEIGHIAFLLRC